MNVLDAHDRARSAASKWGGVWAVFRVAGGSYSYGGYGFVSSTRRIEALAAEIVGHWVSKSITQLEWQTGFRQ